ncbi:MAG TPA: (Fe-S)-binding protein [Vicinamibacteria bacterium]|nr:(Fe-S)-binding protein [Vicinamibacteria bacterium]
MILPVVQSLLTLALLVAAFGFLFVRLRHIVTLVRTGTAGDEVLTDRPGERVGKVAALVLGHQRVLRDPWAGLLHLFFLYGFLTLGIGHLEVVLEGLTSFLRAFGRQPFSYAMVLPAPLLGLYHLSQDLLAAAVLVAASIAMARRWSGHPRRLQPRSQDAENILWFILALYLTFFLLNGASVALRRSGDDSFRAAYQPVASAAAGALSAWPRPAVSALRGFGWWAHVLVFLGFAAYIPMTKHMHLVFAAPNIYLFRKKRYGLPPALDFEKTEKFGVDRVQELPWKTLLDTFACTECNRCNQACPAHQTGKPLKPAKVVRDLKLNLLYRNGADVLRFRDASGRPLVEKADQEAAFPPRTPLVARQEIDRKAPGAVRADGSYDAVEAQVHVDEIWACTTCAACIEACPVLIDSVPGSLLAMRQSLVMMESEFPQEATTAFKGMEVQGNPWGMGQDRRLEWAEGLDVPVMAELGREVDYLYWVGCAAATDPRARRTAQALVRVLKAAKVDFAVLGPEEKCNGDAARRMGNEYLFQQLAQENIETLKQYKFKKMLVSCPHCLNSLGRDYRELGGVYEVVHHTQLLAELMAAGRVPVAAATDGELVTFHDPCYLGRYNQGYEPPREVLVRLGVKKTEMARSREDGFCCGAGGGRIFLEERIGKRVNVERTEQALATGASTIAVACPFCMTMITDGTKAKDVEETVKVKDVAELVAERLAGVRS